jgi:patatin-like phospholipase/acyl hydrolase
VGTASSGWRGEPRSSGVLQQARRQLDWPLDRDFRILSIDGGGIKGIFAATFLARLEATHLSGRGLADHFDMIAGTSTGGIIALALALGMSAADILDLYLSRGADIFPRRRDFGLIRPAYKPDVLRAELRRRFGDHILGDAITRLCIPSADGKHGDVAVFKTPHHPNFARDWTMPAVDIALATSAAPTFLRVHQTGGYYFIDGGVWANNPAMIAVVDALSCFNIERRQIRMLSLGGGSRKPKLGNWQLRLGGIAGWLLPNGTLIESMMHYSTMNADGQAGLLIGRDRLMRIQPEGPAAEVHMTDFVQAARLLPPEAERLAISFGEAIAADFLSTLAEPAVFHHGPRGRPS